VATEVIKLADAEAVAQEAARRWVDIAQSSVTERGIFNVALSGGNTPMLLYSLMASEPWVSQAPWSQTAVFWGDERRVSPSHADSNYRMARELLLDHVPVPSQQVFRMPSEGLASGDASAYEQSIRQHFRLGPRDWPRFDLMLLGMGADGHIASIFPGTRAISDRSSMVLVYEVPKLHEERITLTLPVINQARNALLLVAGEDKAGVVQAVIEGTQRSSTYPAQAVELADGKAVWLLDWQRRLALRSESVAANVSTEPSNAEPASS
jgi:6-phosphogluconolactonase